jgi:hypothetical protein
MVSANLLSMRCIKGLAVLGAVLLFTVLSVPGAESLVEKDVCAVYFTYVGCPHCAITDPLVLSELPEQYPNLFVIEYEFVLEPENSYVLYDYNEEYGCGTGVPLLIFDAEDTIVGDTPILQSIEGIIEEGPNPCPVLGGSAGFADLDLAGMPGKPKVWAKDRILIKTGEGGNNPLLKELLIVENLSAVLLEADFQAVTPEPVLLSGARFPQLNVMQQVEFEHAIRIDNWIFQWNGEGMVPGSPDDNVSGTEPGDETDESPRGITVDWGRLIVSLVSVIIIICVITLIYMRVRG